MAEPDRAILDARFRKLRRALEADGHDASVPGASNTGAWAVLTSGRHGRYLTRCDRDHAEVVAAANVHEGWQPVAVFDLRALEGDPPKPDPGDLVRYEGAEWWVTDIADDVADGQHFIRVCLSNDQNASRFEPPTPGGPTKLIEDIDETEVDVIRRAEPDPRLPCRYDVAAVHIQVSFNTVATP